MQGVEIVEGDRSDLARAEARPNKSLEHGPVAGAGPLAGSVLDEVAVAELGDGRGVALSLSLRQRILAAVDLSAQ